MSLIVTGSIGIDSVETPTGRAENVLGGSGIYFAAAASYFGSVRLLAAVGGDFPEHFMDTFRHFDVDLDGLERRPASKTFRWHAKYHQNMNERETLDVQLNILAEDPPPVPETFRDSQYVFLATTTPQLQLHLLDQFPRRRLVVADTIELYIGTQRDVLLEVLKRIDGLVINDSEARLLTGCSDTLAAARNIIGLGPQFVVLKKGEHGSLLEHADGRVVLPAFPTEQVVDPTGAGDSFAGAMMGYLAARPAAGELSLAALRTAMAYGNVVASFNIESFSLERMKRLTREQIEDRMVSYRGMLDLQDVAR